MSVKIAISQPGLPAYRAPVFQRLANTPGIELSLFAGDLTAGQREVTHLRGASVIPAPTRHLLSNRLFTQPEWSDLVRANRFDLVILPWNIRYAKLLPTLNAARRNKVPVVLWGHGYSKHRRPLTNAIRNHLGRRADAVLVYTRTVARHLIEHAGFNPSKVFIAQNAIDQTPIAHARQHWLSNPTALGAFQNEHRLDPRQTLIFVSRLNQENRVELLLYGLQKLHATHPAAKLVVVGHGPEEQPLRDLARRLNLTNTVLFPGPIYDERVLAPWMLSASFFVYPINIGLSLMQALGYSLPAVTSDALSRQNPEVEALTHGTNGLLYQHNDLDDMVRQWRHLLDNPALRTRMSHEALRTVTDTYTLDNMVQGFLNLLPLARAHIPRPTHKSRLTPVPVLTSNN